MRCLKTIHDSSYSFVHQTGSTMEKFIISLQPCFHNTTGLFSMGHKDSEALWMAGRYNSRGGESGQRKSCLCSYLHHSILWKVWSQDHSTGKYAATTMTAEPKCSTLLIPKPNTRHNPELFPSTQYYHNQYPNQDPTQSNSSISFSTFRVGTNLHLSPSSLLL